MIGLSTIEKPLRTADETGASNSSAACYLNYTAVV